MRSDMKKVVTERPRSGGGIKSPKGDARAWQEFAAEDYPRREKIAVKWSRYSKNFTDVLGPLYHYLLKQVGRKWDAVYSEICANLPKTSMQNRHIYTHIWQFVEKHVLMVNGLACYNHGRWIGEPLISWGRFTQLYIHPGNGLLCKAKKRISFKSRYRPQPEPLVPGIKVYPGVQYHKVKGVWYEVVVEKYALEPVFTNGTYLLPTATINDEVLDAALTTT